MLLAKASIVLMSQTDSGAWTQEAIWSPEGGEVLGHIPPRWDGPELLFIAWRDGESLLCRGGLDASLDCQELGVERVDAWVESEEQLELLVDQGHGDWALRSIELD